MTANSWIFNLVCLFLISVAGADKTFDTRQPQSADEGFILEMEPVKVVNFLSGVPLTSAQDKTGGYGDVVANLIMAREYKERNPNVIVNFIVTTNIFQPKDVVRSDVIIANLVPRLDLNLLDAPQRIDGINYIFSSANNDEQQITAVAKRNHVLANSIPEADLSIQYSANSDPRKGLLELNSKNWISFSEFSGKTPGTQETGFENLGIYLSRSLTLADDDRLQSIKKCMLNQTTPVQF